MDEIPSESRTRPSPAALTAATPLVLVLEGSLTLTIGGAPVRATPGTIVRMPAGVPHALDAPEAVRMLLIMLRDLQDG
jgi:quercetin dioxygenase-like cupin family protein